MMYKNMKKLFTKTAKEPTPPPGIAATVAAAPAPAPAGGGSGTAGKSKINDWSSYITNSKHGTEPDRRSVADTWKSKHPNTYDNSYADFVKWWKTTYSSGGGDATQVIKDLKAIQQTAGATGAQANSVDDNTLFAYMTTPLDNGRAKQRTALFTSLLETGSVKTSSNKQYLGPDMAQIILNNAYWKASFTTAYSADIKANPTLSLILSGPPAETGAATTSPATTPQNQTQAQPQSRVVQQITTPGGASARIVSIGTWGSDEIYLDIASLNSNTVPVLYRQDNRTGKFAPLSFDGSGQWRSRLGATEIARMSRAIVNSGAVQPARIEAFIKYMTTVRQNTGFPGFLKSLVKKRMSREELTGLTQSASTRQSRLDTLRKKGVI